MSRKTLVRAAALAFALAAPSARADDFVVYHSGRLLTSGDLPATAAVKVNVRIYKSREGGTSDLVWQETYDVTPFQGAYSLALGDTRGDKAALTAAHVTGDKWIGFTVDGVELSPRQRLGSVPSALDAAALGGRPASDYALKSDISTDAAKLGGKAADEYALKTDVAPDAAKLGGKVATDYLLRADASTNALTLGGKAADQYALKSELSTDAASLGGKPAAQYALKSELSTDALTLGGKASTEFLGKTEVAADAKLFGGSPPSAFVKTTGGSGDLSLAGLGTFGGLGLTPTTGALPTCNDALSGRFLFDSTNKAFMGCDGRSWFELGNVLGSTPATAGLSCLDIKQRSPYARDGLYWLDYDGTGSAKPFVAVCDMTRDGGGWTLGVKNWYRSIAHGKTGGLGSPYDALDRRGSPYKLSDEAIRGVIGSTLNFDVMGDQNGWYAAYASGNNEYVILRNYTGSFTFGGLMAESTSTTQMQSYRATDNALAWTGRLACGSSGGAHASGMGINCNNVISGGDPAGGGGCTINISGANNPGSHYFYMSEYNTDTYLYICNGSQASSNGDDWNHRWWFRKSQGTR